jgi:hypothetical protein
MYLSHATSYASKTIIIDGHNKVVACLQKTTYPVLQLVEQLQKSYAAAPIKVKWRIVHVGVYNSDSWRNVSRQFIQRNRILFRA